MKTPHSYTRRIISWNKKEFTIYTDKNCFSDTFCNFRHPIPNKSCKLLLTVGNNDVSLSPYTIGYNTILSVTEPCLVNFLFTIQLAKYHDLFPIILSIY